MLGIKTIDIHMSNNDSIDEETKRILAEVDADDSKESTKDKKDNKDIKNPDENIDNNWETNTEETPDSEW